MLSSGLVVLLSVNLIFLTYGKLRVYWVFGKNMYNNYKKTSTHASSKTHEMGTEQDQVIDNNPVKKNESGFFQWIKNAILFLLKWLLIIIAFALIIAFLLVVIGIVTSKIWGTILLAIYTNFVYAAAFLIGINLLFFFLGYGAHKAIKIDKTVTQRALIMDTMQFSMLSILLYFTAFGYPINVHDIVVVPFHWNIVFNNLASISLPMLFFSLITINSLSVIFRIRNMMTKDRNKHKLIRIHQLLFILIASCFIGIVYLTDIDLSFMNDLERTMYLQTLEVVKWIVTSAFIPLFIYTLNNFKKTKSTKKVNYGRRHHYKR